MKHKHVQLLVSASLDGELLESERLVVESHIAACRECRQLVQDSLKIRAGIQSLESVKLPQRFSQHIIHTIESHDIQQEEWRGIEVFAEHALYAIAVLVFVIFLITSITPSSASTSSDPLLVGLESDSPAAQIVIQNGDLSKEDILFSAMTK